MDSINKNIHEFTWRQETRQLQSIIDFVISSQKPTLTRVNVRVFRGADCVFDHYLLPAKTYFTYIAQTQTVTEEEKE